MTERDELLGVNAGDNPSCIRIYFTDRRAHARELWFNKLDKQIAYIEVDGVRYYKPKSIDFDDWRND